MFPTFRKSIVITLFALVLLLAPVPASAATVVYVDEGAVDCAGASFTTADGIQQAIDSVPDGAVIYVCAGTYTNTNPGPVFAVDSRSSLRIMKYGSGTALVQLSVPTIDVGVSVAAVDNSKSITIQGLTIDANGQIATYGTTNWVQGIWWHNSTGALKGNSVLNITHTSIGPGDQDAHNNSSDLVGIFVADDNGDGKTSKVTITGNTVSGFEHRGIVVRRRVKAMITSNIITPLTVPTDFYQAGITVEDGGRATVKGNTISHVVYGQAISIWQASKNNILLNTIDDAQQGISVRVGCMPSDDGPTIGLAEKNKVTRNTLTNIHDSGVNLAADVDSNSECNPQLSKNAVSRNVMSTADGAYVGLRVELNNSGSFSPSASRNSFKSNTIIGFQVMVEDRGDYTKVIGNHR